MVPYCCVDNPIELCFHSYKACLRRMRAAEEAGWLNQHLAALDSVTPAKMRNFVRHCRCYPAVNRLPPLEEEEDDLLMLVVAVAAAALLVTGRL